MTSSLLNDSSECEEEGKHVWRTKLRILKMTMESVSDVDESTVNYARTESTHSSDSVIKYTLV